MAAYDKWAAWRASTPLRTSTVPTLGALEVKEDSRRRESDKGTDTGHRHGVLAAGDRAGRDVAAVLDGDEREVGVRVLTDAVDRIGLPCAAAQGQTLAAALNPTERAQVATLWKDSSSRWARSVSVDLRLNNSCMCACSSAGRLSAD